MSKRALWKGQIRFDDIEVPVKLYSAVQNKQIQFRLLHRKDHSPVKQKMLNVDTGAIIPFSDALKAFVTDSGDRVLLHKSELDTLAPEPSRDIDILAFLPAHLLDHRWYDQPYYLGPDGSDSAYHALIAALEQSQREGVARWTMRNRCYHGMLRLHQGYPLLITLRHAEEVVPVEALPAPGGKAPDKRELQMARHLIDMLQAPFDPDAYHDQYRESVLRMIETKRKGGKIKAAPKRRKAASTDLVDALSASLQQLKKSA